MMRSEREMSRIPLLLGLSTVLVLALGLIVRPLIGLADQSGETEAYRYRFERTERGAVRRALEDEIAFYQKRLTRDPRGGLDLAALAGAYLKMSRATGDLTWLLLAEQTAQRSLASLPFQNSGALLVLARVAEARHEFGEAIRLARRAGGSDGLAIVVTSTLATGQVDEASKVAELLVSTHPGLGSYTLHALVEMARGRDDAAVADLSRAIASEEPGEVGSSAWARTLLGRLHYRRGRMTEARGLYLETLRILPQYPLALLNLAELEMRLREYRKAEDHLTQVVNITRSSPNLYDHAVLRGLAMVKALQGDHRAAARFWDEAEARLRQDVTSGQFGHRRELARLLLERGRREDVDEALRLIRMEVQVRRDAETLYVLAWALSEEGRSLEAREAMQEALRWGVRDAKLFYRAARIEEALGRRAQALSYLASAMGTDPTFDEHARRIQGFGL
jgi:tetratricopeptide (TPR) repeat protein